MVGILAFAAPIERGSVVIGLLARAAAAAAATETGDGRLARVGGAAAHAVGAFDLATGSFEPGVSDLRREGRLTLLARALVLRSRSELHLGH